MDKDWKQFLLLIVINLFVGSMVGLERSVFPPLAQQEFNLTSEGAVIAFLISFGIGKVLGNLLSGGLADRFGRRPVLLAGWCFGVPVPLTMIFAPSWGWVLGANVLLGINQGLCWSMTVIMKIDLAGKKRRGIATALNEWAGYGGVAMAAAGTGYLAQSHGLWPTPFFPGIGIALAGLSLSFFASETANRTGTETQGAHAGKPSFFHLFALASWKDRTLIAANQAGLITNFKDGAMWGLAPLYLAQNELNPAQIGTVTAVYPAIWGFVQLAAGPLSDQWGRKWLIFSGMLLQGFGLGFFVLSTHFWQWTAAAALLGLGTALVYPTLQAAVADRAENSWRASSLGIYRLWRDSGYVLAGAGVGIAANFFDIRLSLGIVAGLSVVSGLVISALMKETLWKDGS